MNEPAGYEINSWMDSEPPLPDFLRVDTEIRTDWLIVGAGFTGLAASAHLARLRHLDRIVMIDGSQLGEASGCRSSGFIVSLGHFDGSPRESAALYRLGTAAIAQLASGQIRAKRVLITNNAHSARLGIAKTRVFPMQIFISVFRCEENQTSYLGASQNWGLTSVERVGSSLRRVNNQIFFFAVLQFVVLPSTGILSNNEKRLQTSTGKRSPSRSPLRNWNVSISGVAPLA